MAETLVWGELQFFSSPQLAAIEVMMAKVKIVEELTPTHLRCVAGTCPAVHALSDGDLLIIGKKLSSELLQEIAHKVAEDEFAVKLSPAFFVRLRETSEAKE